MISALLEQIMSTLLILFLVVLALNVLPAFAPPTWMVFSFLGFRLPSHMGWTFALVGAAAATMGRFLLGKLSRRIVRNKWLNDATRENINSIKVELERRPKMTFAVLLFYAFTPLPSNYLFAAYGLTPLPFIRLIAPFFVGRFVSYYFWTMGGAAVSRRLELEGTEVMTYFGVYFVFTQLALLGLVYVFTRVDWTSLLRNKKWQWLPRSSSDPRTAA